MFFLQFLASKRFSRYLKLFLLFWDLILLNVSFPLALWWRHQSFLPFELEEFKATWLFANVAWVALVFYKDAYKLVRVERIENLLGRTFRLFILYAAAVALVLVLLDYDQLSRLGLLYFFLIFYVLVVFYRIAFLRLLKLARSLGYNFRRVIIVGADECGEKMAEILSSDLSYGYRVEGFFDDISEACPKRKFKLLGKLDEVESYLQEEQISEMYIALHYTEAQRIGELIRLAEKYMLRIKFIPDFYKYTGANKVSVDFYENIPVMMLRKEPLELGINRLSKKLFDILFSLLVITMIFTWLFPILMLLVKISSSGPIFFRQQRTGEDQKAFTCLKFRTMRVNKLSDELQARAGDPRITRIGALMRKTNLDELPQFFNVLWGSMSVVGPRPHMLKHTEEYSELINNYLVRHYAKPGITGWAQVNGFRGETKELSSMKKRVEYDIWYIENWSFLLDLKIIWLTVWNMCRGEKNAY